MSSVSAPDRLVSVALCTYNGGAFLRQQLDSILGQTYKNIEVIALDDCSADDTFSILEHYSRQDSRLKIFRNETNIGYNRNFEKAIALAGGEWIALSDQDDIWHPDKIAILLAEWDQSSSLVYCASKKITNHSQVDFLDMKPSSLGLSGSNAGALACKNCTEGHTIMLHHSLKPFQLPDQPVYYDWWAGMVATVRNRIQWIGKVLVWRLIHDTNAFERNQQTGKQLIREWMMHLEAFLGLEGLKEEDRRFISQCIEMKGKSYGEWRRFIFRNRRLFFYYKQSKNLLSLLKNSHRLAKQLTNQ